MNRAVMLAVVGMLTISHALAAKPAWADDGRNGKSGNSGQKEQVGKQDGHRGDDDRSARDHGQRKVRAGEYFEDRQRTIVHEYYVEQFRRGHCPPGLAKKHNGCMPPGQARKWTVGRPLPRDVIYHDAPRELVAQLERPSAGYRYVRVASDILLIALGTGMVIDGIRDLGRL